ncbi:Hypothetical protein Cp4202_2089 [Corynebacterium pseudotuberculosis 42/02-A]|nr:Hypothetical protein Cp4202_2089 [Corynebacterium pseudotuberculosis 42/02-A]
MDPVERTTSLSLVLAVLESPCAGEAEVVEVLSAAVWADCSLSRVTTEAA